VSTHARRHLSSRAKVLLVSVTSVLVLLAVALLLPVPFVKLAPGPTFNVIGDHDGQPVIKISDTTTYPVTGELDMTTVLESGGPRGGLTFIDAVTSWFQSSNAVLPRELMYPDDVSGTDVKAKQTAMFSTAESNATAAALGYLKMPVSTKIVVSAVWADSPADGQLEARDEILTIDGVKITGAEQVRNAVQAKPIGTDFAITVLRDDTAGAKNVDVTVKSEPNPNDDTKPYIGISVGEYYSADFPIAFTLDTVGGPSAGLMFTLGLIDKLSPDDLAGGKHIAGTGTIDPTGKVGPIGGIRQKLAGARAAGAELFLMPKVHCTEAAGHIPDGLTVTPVETVTDAVNALHAWGKGAKVPSCPVSS
jgi:PDZ domain-containing protein